VLITCALGGTLVFRGGSKTSPPKVAMVLYGPGPYADYITDNTTSNFYRQIINSTWIDWLSEYNVPSANYTIQRGSFIGVYSMNVTFGTVVDGVVHSDQSAVHNDLLLALKSGALPMYVFGLSKGLFLCYM
jgi:hypothetical protein